MRARVRVGEKNEILQRFFFAFPLKLDVFINY